MHVYLLPGLVTTNHLQFESGAEYQIPFGGKRHLCLEKVITKVKLASNKLASNNDFVYVYRLE